ncbi:hypothetical protein C922_05541 [Plasmodium inui San Antonio 1]|uniref:Uncharacterized protein n=1 Tax=Plasmodium inui San Antonio 1 TaxID=1237626 RepID=W6ZXQ8_9APIC|nr:hypothetical protein C922_05541 [Plasmodium inui San Antonio 1]EUD64078.1 hypothetical protein C922_05541 [Plasmodium inui San Antonio 1]
MTDRRTQEGRAVKPKQVGDRERRDKTGGKGPDQEEEAEDEPSLREKKDNRNSSRKGGHPSKPIQDQN